MEKDIKTFNSSGWINVRRKKDRPCAVKLDPKKKIPTRMERCKVSWSKNYVKE